MAAWYQWNLKKRTARHEDEEDKAGWSHDYTKEVFQCGKRFVNWLWDEGVIEGQPRGLRQRFDFGSGVQKVITWTVEEVQEALGKASEFMQLVILLYLNCGMTQTDIAELRESEVDLLRVCSKSPMPLVLADVLGTGNVDCVPFGLDRADGGSDECLLSSAWLHWIPANAHSPYSNADNAPTRQTSAPLPNDSATG